MNKHNHGLQFANPVGTSITMLYLILVADGIENQWGTYMWHTDQPEVIQDL